MKIYLHFLAFNFARFHVIIINSIKKLTFRTMLDLKDPKDCNWVNWFNLVPYKTSCYLNSQLANLFLQLHDYLRDREYESQFNWYYSSFRPFHSSDLKSSYFRSLEELNCFIGCNYFCYSSRYLCVLQR